MHNQTGNGAHFTRQQLRVATRRRKRTAAAVVLAIVLALAVAMIADPSLGGR